MWRRLADERFDRVEANEERPGFGTTVRVTDGGSLTMQRWVHADGRYAVHVSDADPELLVLDAAGPDDDGTVLREYDLKGQGVEPDSADPLKGAREVRAVVAPRPEDDADAWGILRGWS